MPRMTPGMTSGNDHHDVEEVLGRKLQRTNRKALQVPTNTESSDTKMAITKE
jgi:hypothetical protein